MTNRTVAARGGLVALAVGLVTAVTGLGLGVLPAAAHASLISSTPEDGATLDDSPAEVVLEFDDDLLAEFTQVAVLDEEDGNHEQGDPEIDGGRVAQAVGALEPGEYRVSYRVGSGDGHPVSGVITFTVAEAPAAPEQDATEPEGDPTGQYEPDTDASADTAGEPAAEQAASTPAAESAATGGGGVAPLGIVGAAAAVAAAAAFAFARTRRRGDGSEPTQNPDP
ncbi:MAG: copper resistance protein CopC [bacterium]